MIFCFVCGHLRPSKTLIEHIDKCYRRVEAETSLTSIFETKVEGSKRLFCDAYNNNTKAFCKRLKVNHLKPPNMASKQAKIWKSPKIRGWYGTTGTPVNKNSRYRLYGYSDQKRFQILIIYI